ncbi:MAG: enoyl-CoA hydratase [Alphaproteobacteria bacterium]|jgi:enoyl-CoA hydratase/carnithine racemase|nr:enoyl-CoA hydratase [Alphaproteobacteria bacterium]MBT4016417.1 enoyl-CoA hydratase [Alphaproteobacteria bacterium]MBT4965407.1 enoyl-CoA hydratase [Alphaproteobacteria bacterium]MBT5160308.1 enoyl-CoA hydratase [Alphaproteobacteria bacterium]MBT6385216.1 enoyl-CoA hydratase [Alphaproteobacteria bacterium]
MPQNANKSAHYDVTSAPLLREDKDGITTLTLNRPDKFNCLSLGLLNMLQETLDNIAKDPAAKVIVIAANGRAFCAGHDLAEVNSDPSVDPMEHLMATCAHMMQTIVSIPQPVIAKVQGVATAAGCQLVAQCDLAIAADSSRFGTSGINLGLFCSTPMIAVTRNLPRKQAMELLMTGDLIDAPTALSWGLLNKVVPLDELDAAVDEMAIKIASKSRAAIAIGKELFYAQINEGLDTAYKLGAAAIVRNLQKEDARNGIDAFLNKRDMPEWQDK